MDSQHAEHLRKAVEALIDAKLLDALGKPGGLDRLLAYRATGVAPFGVRMAQRKLQDVLEAAPEHEFEHEEMYSRH